MKQVPLEGYNLNLNSGIVQLGIGMNQWHIFTACGQ